MIHALWANSNYDDDKGTRKQAIQEIETQYEETLKTIISGPKDDSATPQEEEISEDNPFFAPTKEAMRKLDAIMPSLEGTVRDALATEQDDYGKDVDQ